MSASNGVHKAASREEIMAAAIPLRREWVAIPEWPGGGVYISEMTGRDRDRMEETEYELRKSGAGGLVGFPARMLVRVLVDGEGVPIFMPDDAEWLSNQPTRIVSRLADIAQTINRITEADIEEAEKNSVSGQSVGSGSA